MIIDIKNERLERINNKCGLLGSKTAERCEEFIREIVCYCFELVKKYGKLFPQQIFITQDDLSRRAKKILHKAGFESYIFELEVKPSFIASKIPNRPTNLKGWVCGISIEADTTVNFLFYEWVYNPLSDEIKSRSKSQSMTISEVLLQAVTIAIKDELSKKLKRRIIRHILFKLVSLPLKIIFGGRS